MQVNPARPGTGEGNVYDQTLGIEGFDFVEQGCWTFGANQGDDRYQARWQSAQELVIVLRREASPKVEECTLHATLRNYIYVREDGRITTKPIGKPGPHSGHQ
jgi:hypothetical protein